MVGAELALRRVTGAIGQRSAGFRSDPDFCLLGAGFQSVPQPPSTLGKRSWARL